MTMTEIIREYAEALYEIACEENSRKEYAKTLEMLSAAFGENPEYIEFLICPGIPLSERLKAVEDAFAGRVPEYIVMFIQLLCEKGRIQLFSQCVADYVKLVDASENIAVAKITSAVKLTQSEMDGIRLKLEKLIKKRIVMECITDPSIMGGVIIETEGRIIDGSLRRSLHEVKEVIGR